MAITLFNFLFLIWNSKKIDDALSRLEWVKFKSLTWQTWIKSRPSHKFPRNHVIPFQLIRYHRRWIWLDVQNDKLIISFLENLLNILQLFNWRRWCCFGAATAFSKPFNHNLNSLFTCDKIFISFKIIAERVVVVFVVVGIVNALRVTWLCTRKK